MHREGGPRDVQRLQEFAFVRSYMIATTVALVWFVAAFPVGARRGVRAGAVVLLSGLWAYVASLAAISVWALSTGQWATFADRIGTGVLAEMAVFVFLVLYTAYFMATRYLNDKRRKELAGVASGSSAEGSLQG